MTDVQRTRKRLLAAAIAFVATGAGTLLTIWQFGGQATPLIWVVGVAAVAAATAGAVALADDPRRVTRAPGLRGPRSDDPQWQERRRTVQAAVEDLLGAAAQVLASRPERTGAVVYFPDAAGVLRPAFSHNKDRPLGALPSFEKWQGRPGDAWGRGAQTVADLAEVGVEQLVLAWKLTPAQIEATRDVKTVVSMPIYAQEPPQRMIGVVSFDSTMPLGRSGLGTPRALSAARQIAGTVARILELAGMDAADLV